MSRSAEFEVGGSPLQDIQEGARRFGMQHEWFNPHVYDAAKNAVMAPGQSRKLAGAYENTSLRSDSPHVEHAYKQMASDANDQFEFMTKPHRQGGLGIHVEVTKDDPYGGEGARPNDIFKEMRSDVENHGRIKILSTHTTGGHQYHSDDQNDRIRAVHDVFGHLGSGRGIDMHGEEAAYQRHASMFSPLGRQPTATEFRGQTAFLLKHNEFPAQRMDLIPAHMRSPQFAKVGATPADVEDARLENHKQGL